MRLASPLCLALLLACGSSLADPVSDVEDSSSETASENHESASPTPSMPSRPALPERSEQDANTLRERLPVREQQTLNGMNESLLALYKPANVGEPLGTVVILSSNDQHAESPMIIAPLRHKLPDAGWNTLAISLPDPFDPLPERTVASISLPGDTQIQTPTESTEAPTATPATDAEAPANSEEPAISVTTEAPADEETLRAQALAQREERRSLYEQRITQRIEAALAFAKEQGAHQLVLLGQGAGGYWAARYVHDTKPSNLQGLILISPQSPRGFGPELDALISASLPTGDFYFKNQPAQVQAAAERRNASKRLRADNYRSTGLQALSSDPSAEQEQVYRRVRGWLQQTLAEQH